MYFEQTLPPVHAEIPWITSGRITGVSQLVATVAGRRIYDVSIALDTLKSGYYDTLKLILIENGTDVFCPVYFSATGRGTTRYDPSFLTETRGGQILSTQGTVAGTGNYRDEAYWLLDSSAVTYLPVMERVGQALAALLPAEHGVWKGGGFDPASLIFRHMVWRTGDGNCCPSGGRVSLIFAIENRELVLKSGEHQPPG
jgi:hypothetical protein